MDSMADAEYRLKLARGFLAPASAPYREATMSAPS